MQAIPARAVLTGGPGAGKSTLLAAADAAGITTFPEVARDILRRPGGMAMRADRPADFAQAMLEAQGETWRAAEALTSPVLFDRGFADIAGFLELEGLPLPATLDDVCQTHRYTGPIFRAPPWQAIYAGDSERIQSWEEALASDAAICAAWAHYGYQLIDLPLAPVADRLDFILNQFEARQGSA